MKTATVYVDLDDPVNASPKQQLDDGEAIVVMKVKLESLLEELKRYSDEGCQIFEGVYGFAYGLRFAEQMKKD